MSQELNIDNLEGTEGTEGTAVAKVKKELTIEDVVALKAATEKIVEFGVSENFAKVLPLVSVWHEKDGAALAETKAAVIAAFGDSDKFKDYIGGEFEAELAVISGIAKSTSVLNNIKSFYKRRGDGTKQPRAKKVPMMQINIGGKPHTINTAYYEEIVKLPNDEKKALLLAHPDTKEAAAIEAL